MLILMKDRDITSTITKTMTNDHGGRMLTFLWMDGDFSRASIPFGSLRHFAAVMKLYLEFPRVSAGKQLSAEKKIFRRTRDERCEDRTSHWNEWYEWDEELVGERKKERRGEQGEV